MLLSELFKQTIIIREFKERYNIETVEEAQQLPDEQILRLRGIGKIALKKLRSAVTKAPEPVTEKVTWKLPEAMPHGIEGKEIIRKVHRGTDFQLREEGELSNGKKYVIVKIIYNPEA